MEAGRTVEHLDADDLASDGADPDVDARFDLDVLGGFGIADPGVQQVHFGLVIALDADGLL
jgi:hypothetical protein